MSGIVDYLLAPGEMAGPDTVARKRKQAEDLLRMGMDTSPVEHWSQGASRLVQGLLGGLQEARADRAEREGRAAASKDMAAALAGMMGGAVPTSSSGGVAGALAGTSASAMPPDQVKAVIDANVPEEMRPFAYRMAQKESGFRPDATSPTGAKGLFQFTGGTWGDITGQSVGRAGDNRADPTANTQAFVALTDRNRQILRNGLGREPTWGELAVAHQQGPAGALALLTGRGAVDPRNLAVQAGSPKSAADIMAYYGFGQQPTAMAGDLVSRPGDTAKLQTADLVQRPGSSVNLQGQPLAYAPSDSDNPTSGFGARTANPAPWTSGTGGVLGGRPIPLRSGADAAVNPGLQPGGNGADASPPDWTLGSNGGFQRTPPTPGQTATPAAPVPLPPPRPADLGQQQAAPVHPQAVMQAAQSPQVQQAAVEHAQTPQGQQLIQQARNAPMAALFAAMSDPWMTDGQKSLLVMLAKQRMEAMNPTYGFQTLPDGTVLRTDPRNGTVAPIYQAQPKPMALGSDQRLIDPNTGRELVGAGPGITDATKNYSFYVQQEQKAGRQPLSFNDWEIAQKRAGATAITNDMRGENAFDVGIGQKQSAMFSDLSDDGRQAKVDLGNIRQLRREIAKTPGGFLGGAQAFANSWGIKLGPNVDSVEAASSIIDRLTPAQRQGMPGAASDRDVAMFKGSLLKLSNTPGGNEKIATTLEALAQHRIRMAEIANKVITGRMTRAQGMDALEALPDPFEAVRGDMEGASTPGTGPNGQPTNLQSPAEQGLRQIDTSRPGRFRYNPATGQLEPE